MFFKTDPMKQMQSHRDAAERIALTHLEGHAVAGTITKQMLFAVAKAINHDPNELIEMIPDRRRPARHAKAMDGLRKIGLIGERQTFSDFQRYEDNR